MANRKRGKKKRHFSRHHIVPKSRHGGWEKSNIAHLNTKEHQNYHTLFSNLTPDEIIIYLVKHFWNGQEFWVEKALDEIGGSYGQESFRKS